MASRQMPAPYPVAGGSLWIKRVVVRTPGHRASCIAGWSARQEMLPGPRSRAPSGPTAGCPRRATVTFSVPLVVVVYDVPQCLH